MQYFLRRVLSFTRSLAGWLVCSNGQYANEGIRCACVCKIQLYGLVNVLDGFASLFFSSLSRLLFGIAFSMATSGHLNLTSELAALAAHMRHVITHILCRPANEISHKSGCNIMSAKSKLRAPSCVQNIGG